MHVYVFLAQKRRQKSETRRQPQAAGWPRMWRAWLILAALVASSLQQPGHHGWCEVRSGRRMDTWLLSDTLPKALYCRILVLHYCMFLPKNCNTFAIRMCNTAGTAVSMDTVSIPEVSMRVARGAMTLYYEQQLSNNS
jgi:hypothetical protein